MNLKKILLPIATLALIIGLGGCIITFDPDPTPKPAPTPTPSYNLTVNNTTDTDIYDWFVDNKYGDRFSINGSKANPIKSTESSTINLYRDYYIVYFAYVTNKKQYLYSPSDRDKKAYTYLNKDMEFSVYDNIFQSRTIDDGTSIPNFYMIDAEGNKVEMELVEIVSRE